MYKLRPDSIVSSNLPAKDIIIDVLSKNWPLSSKKIFFSVNKQYNRSITYQAVHKALQELIKDNAVVRENESYKLNIDWILSMKNYLDMLHENYSNNKSMVSIDGKISQIEFASLWDMYVAVLNVIESGVLDITKRRIGTCFFYHFWNWNPMIFSKKEYDQILNIVKQNPKCYMIGNRETLIDRKISNFYQGLEWRTVTGKNVGQPNVDTIVHGDTVVHVYFSDNIQNALKSQLENNRNLAKIDLNKLYQNMFHLKTKIIITVNHNPSLAMQLHAIGENMIPRDKRYKDFYAQANI